MALMGWATHVLQWEETKSSQLATVRESHKTSRSPDWSLQLDSMKLESLVIVDQHATVNTFPGLVHTARHTMGVVFILRRDFNLRERASTVGAMTGVKS